MEVKVKGIIKKLKNIVYNLLICIDTGIFKIYNQCVI